MHEARISTNMLITYLPLNFQINLIPPSQPFYIGRVYIHMMVALQHFKISIPQYYNNTVSGYFHCLKTDVRSQKVVRLWPHLSHRLLRPCGYVYTVQLKQSSGLNDTLMYWRETSMQQEKVVITQ